MSAPVSYRVLIVDDDPADIELVSKAIGRGRFPCVVERAVDGVEAMEMLRSPTPESSRKNQPDLVLLDINMPRKNGLQVLSEIRSDPSLRHLPVVMLSTSSAEHDVSVAYRSGAQGYVTKPMDVRDLFAAIHAVEEYWFNTVRAPCR
ncbi:response regulator [Paramagnetospirillum marisnigri]|uniref:Response regulator n=1 Tax=Paramagnetospirillum marisnigri TaxID=1285242 RepID=A0A178MSX5_9PROT|nr:response regulator [Paramagnetospirillum marisnigri]OAN52742.1 response regulator [Paramagnetospirillum marisnigri]